MTVVVPGRPAGADRHAQAHAALRAAELRTGVRRERRHTLTVAAAPVVPVSPVPVLPEAPPAPERPARERPEARTRHRTDHHRTDHVALAGRRLPVHPVLARLLPEGGLTTGSTVVVRGSTTLLLALLAEASRAGAWTAIVGHPAAGLAAAADAGLDLDRTVTVPAPGPDAPAVVAALLDGLDVVVLGPRTALLDADRRRLATRARERGAVLVTVDAQPGAHVVLDTRAGTWSGLDHGSGWLRRRTLTVRRTGRGAAARPVEVEVEVPLRADVVVPGRVGGTAGAGLAAGGGGTAGAGLAAGGGGTAGAGLAAGGGGTAGAGLAAVGRPRPDREHNLTVVHLSRAQPEGRSRPENSTQVVLAAAAGAAGAAEPEAEDDERLVG